MAEEMLVDGAHVKRRHPFAPLGLTIITLGIYAFVWWYQINRELRDQGETVDPALSVVAVTIGWLLIVPPFVSIYRTAERIQRVRERSGIQSSSVADGEMLPWLAVVLFIVPVLELIWQAYLQHGLNTAYDQLARSSKAAPTTA